MVILTYWLMLILVGKVLPAVDYTQQTLFQPGTTQLCFDCINILEVINSNDDIRNES